MGTGAVGLNPIGGALRGGVNRHDHAAIGETALVLIPVFGLDVSKVAVLVTMERCRKVLRSQDGPGSARDPDFSQREQRSCFHWGCQ